MLTPQGQTYLPNPQGWTQRHIMEFHKPQFFGNKILGITSIGDPSP